MPDPLTERERIEQALTDVVLYEVKTAMQFQDLHGAREAIADALAGRGFAPPEGTRVAHSRSEYKRLTAQGVRVAPPAEGTMTTIVNGVPVTFERTLPDPPCALCGQLQPDAALTPDVLREAIDYADEKTPQQPEDDYIARWRTNVCARLVAALKETR